MFPMFLVPNLTRQWLSSQKPGPCSLLEALWRRRVQWARFERSMQNVFDVCDVCVFDVCEGAICDVMWRWICDVCVFDACDVCDVCVFDVCEGAIWGIGGLTHIRQCFSLQQVIKWFWRKKSFDIKSYFAKIRLVWEVVTIFILSALTGVQNSQERYNQLGWLNLMFGFRIGLSIWYLFFSIWYMAEMNGKTFMQTLLVMSATGEKEMFYKSRWNCKQSHNINVVTIPEIKIEWMTKING